MGEPIPRGEDVEHLRHPGHQRQADADRIDLAQGLRAGDHQHHATQRNAQRGPACAIQPLAEPQRRGQRHAGGVEVEHEQGERDRDSLEGDEGGEVQDRVGDRRRQHEPPVPYRQRPDRPWTNAGECQAQADEQANDERTQRGTPCDKGERLDSGVSGESAQRSERPEAGRRQRHEASADQVGARLGAP
jgi:hypothetical protein